MGWILQYGLQLDRCLAKERAMGHFGWIMTETATRAELPKLVHASYSLLSVVVGVERSLLWNRYIE
jgi:hypothetical protein